MVYNEALKGIKIYFPASAIEWITLWLINSSIYKKLNKWS